MWDKILLSYSLCIQHVYICIKTSTLLSFPSSLLHEAEPASTSRSNVQDAGGGGGGGDEGRDEETSVVEERQLLSKYGIWLLVGLCTPDEHTPHASTLFIALVPCNFHCLIITLMFCSIRSC